jgi:hypothetical protein
VKSGNLTDAELRELERNLQAEVPVMLGELRQDIASSITEAVAVAGARRYGDKNWSAEVGTT